MAIAVVDNSSPTSGDLNDEAWDAYNATVTALLLQHGSDGSHGASGDAVPRALFDANTILYATTDDTPVALTVAASRIVGRKSTGNIVALTAAEVLTILGLEADLANLTSVEVDQLEAIGTNTISNTEWGYLAACTAQGGALLDDADADTQLGTLGLSVNLGDLTDVEAAQLENIGATTISATQWGYLGAMDYQPLANNIVKGWIQFNGTGVIAIQDSFNVSSIVDNGVGTYTINWDTDFANDDYAISGICAHVAAEQIGWQVITMAVGSIQIAVKDKAGAGADSSIVTMLAIGDQ